jgi:hypothetical protein
MDVRIGGEVAGNVLDQLAAMRVERCGEKNGRQIGPAASQRHDCFVCRTRQKSRDDEDVGVRKPRQQRTWIDERVARPGDAIGLDQAGLVHVAAGGANTRGVQRQHEQRDRPQFTG